MKERAAWWMVFVLFCLYVMSWLDRLIISMLVAPIKADLGLSDFQMGLILGPAFGIAYAIAGLPMGWAADNYSRRWVIFAGGLTWTLATISCGLARSFETLLVARVFVGVGEAALLPAAYSLIADSFSRDRLTLATSVFQMAGKVGSAAAFGIGAGVIAYVNRGHFHLPEPLSAESWQLVMVLVGLPGFLFALMLFTINEPPRSKMSNRERQQEGKAAGIAFARENGRLMALMIVGFSSLAVCGYAFTAWLPTFVERGYSLGPEQYGVSLSLMNLIAAATLVANGKIVDVLFSRGLRDAHLRYYSWQIAVALPILGGMFFIDNIYLFLACYCLFTLITAPLMIYVSALVALLAPPAVRAQVLAGFLFIFTMLGMGIGPALVSSLTDYVFVDEAKLGASLAIVCTTSLAIAFIAMRMALAYLRPAIDANDALLAAAAADAA